MKRLYLTIYLIIIICITGSSGCNSGTSEESGFNLIFRYGVMARNELNTFERTFTKDMIGDPPVTIDFSLTEEELDSIYQKMLDIGFFDYPDEFSAIVAPDSPIGIVTPFSSYYFKVEYETSIKELWWDDEITWGDDRIKVENTEEAEKLSQLIKLIRDIIESKEEYRELPEPTGGYM